jgi:outer membrane protein assembly factor BamB
MLKGFSALAPAKPSRAATPREDPGDFIVLTGASRSTQLEATTDAVNEWPTYRHDASRSGAATCDVPTDVRVRWRRQLTHADDQRPKDWQENPFVSGVISAPVIASGLAIVSLPDRHHVVALDAATGEDRWQYTADGRIDTPPTIVGNLCLFGTRTGWVYCMSAADGQVVWRLRAAVGDEQIVSFGQVESPWPVPGSVLVIDNTAYFAAGRQYLADGGIRVFAVAVDTGRIQWVKRIDDLPEFRYYHTWGLEFDNFDLLVREGQNVSMSRWQFDRVTGAMSVVRKSGFGHFATGPGGGVMAPRGLWSYGPRMTYGHKLRATKRPLVVFRDNSLMGCTDDRRRVYRRDFALDGGETFDDEWYSVRHRNNGTTSGGEYTRTERLMRGAAWVTDDVSAAPISAMLLTRDTCIVADEDGTLLALAVSDGKPRGRHKLPAQPIWDGLAAAYERLYVATADGSLICVDANEPVTDHSASR